MHYLSENPWPLAGSLGLLAVGFLMMLKVTQQGKYLVRAGIAGGLALLVLGIEFAWVTDAERIERVLAEIAASLRASDAEGVVRHLAPDVEVEQGDEDLGRLDPGLIRQILPHIEFQHLYIDRLDAQAGQSTRRGRATFRASAAGTDAAGLAHQGFAGVTAWDLGFQEVSPGDWKVTRITPTRLDPRVAVVLRTVVMASQVMGRGR